MLPRRALLSLTGLGGLAGLIAGLSTPAEAAARRPASAENRLAELGLALPSAPAPVANYAAYTRSGNHVFIAGQGPSASAGEPALGRLGGDLDVDQGYAAAHAAGLNVLAQLRAAAGGSLDQVARCLALTVFVNSADDFHDQPQVANGASDLFAAIFGDAGLGARAAVGANTLPFNVAVEVTSQWELVT